MLNKYAEDVLVLTADSWHGEHDFLLPQGISLEAGYEISQLSDIEWVTRPLHIEVEPGVFKPFGNKFGLARLPNERTDEWHILDNRLVRDYEALTNDFLMELASDLAERTGWEFEGCGTLRHNEISFIQLRVPGKFDVAGLEYERHVVRIFYADDKAGGAAYIGLTLTRIQCDNTFRAAISGESVLTVEHRDNPEARMTFINEQAVAVADSLKDHAALLNAFFGQSMSDGQFDEFANAVYPQPKIKGAMLDAAEANRMLDDGQVSLDLSVILKRGERANKEFLQEAARAQTRREELKAAYETHNLRFPDSKNTLYAALQALTWLANHSSVYRGNALAGLLFNGQRAKDVALGISFLRSLTQLT